MYIEYVTIHVHRVCNYMYIVDICKNMNKVKYMKLFIKINALISHGQQTCSWSSDRQHLYPEWKGTGSIGNPQRFWTRLCWPIAIWKCRSYCNLQSSFVCSHNQISYIRQNYYQLKKNPRIKWLVAGFFFVYQHRHDTVLTSHAVKFNCFNFSV